MSTTKSMMLSLVVALLPLEVAVADEGAPSMFVGRGACLECHALEHEARPCSLEIIPEHDRSYEALSKPEAEEIALLCGVGGPPRESRICLGCHATAADEGPRWTRDTFKQEDGVQCEACHGPGSAHVDDYSQRIGPPPRRPTNIRWVDRASCMECHVKRTSHEEVLKLGFKRRPADHLYKTPVNLAVSPDGAELYVVCAHSHSLMIVDTKSGDIVGEIEVGRRPHDVAVSPDGRRLYVTNRLADSVTVIEALSRKIVAEVPVGHEPHGVLTDAAGDQIYILNTGDNTISVLDARTLEPVRRLVAGRGPWSLAMSRNAELLRVTNVRPSLGRYRDPPRSEVTTIGLRRDVVTHRAVVHEANMMEGIASIPGRDIMLFTLMRTKNLVPMTRLAQGWVITNGLGVIWPDGRVDQVLLDEPNASFPDPIDVAVSPDGRFALVSSGGSDQVAVVDVTRLLDTITSTSDAERDRLLPNHLGMSERFVIKRIHVANNPRGIVFSPDGRAAYVANALDDSVAVIETATFTVTRKIHLGGPEEITEIRWGERLFHNAEITFGRQFSCRSCHPDGHQNGLAFDIEADGIGFSPVDNRTLRGIFDTPPFKWEGTNPTLDFQCGPRLAVFFTRLEPFTPAELTALVRYECTIERPKNVHRKPDGLTPAQRRGKAIFERSTDNLGQPMTPQRRCSTCHNNPYKTSRRQVATGTTMWFDKPLGVPTDDPYDPVDFGQFGNFGFMDSGIEQKVFDVPHLVNIYDSAPYLHNGSAPTLEEIWTRLNMTEGHGLTGDLTREQFNDLIAYLKAL